MKSSLGQYFTKDLSLKNKVFEFIKNNPALILEPSIGRGDLVTHVSDKIEKVKFDMFEIDNSITLLEKINKTKVIYGDFLKQNISRKYKTIIGNPPYVRTSKGNLYIDFTEKCFNLLEDNGELIFIVPSDFFKLTASVALLEKMMNVGTFTHIYHPNDEHLFKEASIDVIVYRYSKNTSLGNITYYNGEKKYINNNNGLITFHDNEVENNKSFKDYFTAHVGMVTGAEKIFKNNEYGNLELLNSKQEKEKYIYIDKFPTENPSLNKYMESHKKHLISRKIKKFNETNWFQWGAIRNLSITKNNLGKDCIYIHTLTRKEIVAFKSKVTYFGGGLIMLLPHQKIDLNLVVNYLNSEKFKKNFIYSGRFKIGQRQIINATIDCK
jgi:adenine-specific DNA-methyltransferase